jgi:DNA-nicking Smr family endonuclease
VKKKEEISNLDHKTWEEYIKNPKDVFDKDITKNKNLKHTQFRFDLHGYTLLEANKKVKNIINECSEKNYKEILLITGKGLHSNTEKDTYVSKNLSKLKYSIPEYINSDEELKKKIIKIDKAEIKDGGDGALIIKLK